MVDVFEEVNEDLKDDKFNKQLKKYGPILIILSVLIILFTAGKGIYSNNLNKTNEKQTILLNEMVNSEVVEAEKLIASVDDSHKFLADFLLAGSYAKAGDLEESNKVYDELIKSNSVSSEYKDVARVYFVQNTLNMEAGDLSKAKQIIKPLLSEDNSFYYIALEQKAMLDYKAGDIDSAKKIFGELYLDESAPSEIKDRAEKITSVL